MNLRVAQLVAAAVPIFCILRPAGIAVMLVEQVERAFGKFPGTRIIAIHARVFHSATQRFRHARIVRVLFRVLQNDFRVVVGL